MRRDIQHATTGSGTSLPHGALSRMGAAFSADFSTVRVHTASAADEVASKLNAHALTAGPDIVFRAGAYNPGTRSGDRLLAHELAHVVQQRDGAARAPIDSGPSDPLERAADGTADNVVRALWSTYAPAEASVGHVDGAGQAVLEPGGTAAAVQRAPAPQPPSPDPQAKLRSTDAFSGLSVFKQVSALIGAVDGCTW
jgi:Domain of unknown function (DUF4157)